MKAKRLIKGELIGLGVKVISSKNQANDGLQGKVVDETKNTFVLKTVKGKKRLIKQNCVFEFEVGRKRVRIEGKILAKRPEERIKLRLR